LRGSLIHVCHVGDFKQLYSAATPSDQVPSESEKRISLSFARA